MFGSITKHFKDQVVGRAIHDLATTGTTGLDGIGSLKYDYINNELTMTADPKVLEEIRKHWEQNHHGVEYEI